MDISSILYAPAHLFIAQSFVTPYEMEVFRIDFTDYRATIEQTIGLCKWNIQSF